MTKNEVKSVIMEKMESAKKDHTEYLAKKDSIKTFPDFENCIYYQGYYMGVQRVLHEAMQLIGMLDREHNNEINSVKIK